MEEFTISTKATVTIVGLLLSIILTLIGNIFISENKRPAYTVLCVMLLIIYFLLIPESALYDVISTGQDN